MAIIEKKCWPELFEKIVKGEKNIEFRLADFALAPGDIILLKEFDPRTNAFTGRETKKACKHVAKFNPLDFYAVEQLKKFGCYLIEFE